MKRISTTTLLKLRIRLMSLRGPPPAKRAPKSMLSLLAVVLLAAACGPESMPTTTEPLAAAPNRVLSPSAHVDRTRALEAVFAGNAQSIIAAPALVPPGAPLAPFIEARLYAIANIAMHDALNAI